MLTTEHVPSRAQVSFETCYRWRFNQHQTSLKLFVCRRGQKPELTVIAASVLGMRSIAKDLATRRFLCTSYGTNSSCRSLISILQGANKPILRETGSLPQNSVKPQAGTTNLEFGSSYRMASQCSPLHNQSASFLYNTRANGSQMSFSGSSGIHNRCGCPARWSVCCQTYAVKSCSNVPKLWTGMQMPRKARPWGLPSMLMRSSNLRRWQRIGGIQKAPVHHCTA